MQALGVQALSEIRSNEHFWGNRPGNLEQPSTTQGGSRCWY